MARVIVDAGPLLALFDRKAADHAWVAGQFAGMRTALLTCEAVLTETVFLMHRDGMNPEWLFDAIQRGTLRCQFNLASEMAAISGLFRRYSDRAISIADASLIRMSELHPDGVIFTLDRDFLIYRRNGRQKIPLIAPFA